MLLVRVRQHRLLTCEGVIGNPSIISIQSLKQSYYTFITPLRCVVPTAMWSLLEHAVGERRRGRRSGRHHT